jgi:hypothetical protein
MGAFVEHQATDKISGSGCEMPAVNHNGTREPVEKPAGVGRADRHSQIGPEGGQSCQLLQFLD